MKDRANAVVQWLMAAADNPELIQGAWLLLLESDYVWMKPLQVSSCWHRAGSGRQFAAPFAAWRIVECLLLQ